MSKLGKIHILKANNTPQGAVVFGQITTCCAPYEVLVHNLGRTVAARVTGPVVNTDSAAARLLGHLPFTFEANLGFPQVPSPGQQLTVTAISKERQILAQSSFPWPKTNLWEPNSVKISRAQLMSFGQILHVNGWLADSESVSRIELRSGNRVQLAKLGTARPDVLENHPEVGTTYSGFEVRLDDFALGETAELAIFDLSGQLVLQRPVTPKPQDVFMRRRAAPYDAIAVAYDGRLLAVSTSIRGLEPPLKFHLKGPSGFFASQPAACSEGAKAPAALSSNHAAWVGTAVFAMGAKPEDKLELLVEDRKGAVVFSDIRPFITETSAKPKIENAYYCSQTRNLVVQGSCGFLGVTHVHAKVGGKPISASRTFLKKNEDFLDAPDTGFYLASLLEMKNGELVEIEFFAGTHKLGSQSKPIKEQRINQSQILGPSCRSSQGAAHYQFESAALRPDAPWIIYATGMASWPITGGGQARSYAMARYLRRQGYRVALVVDYPNRADDTTAADLKEFADAVVFAPLGGTQPGTAPDYVMYKKSKAELGPLLETLEAGYAPRATIINFAFNLYAAENLKGPVILDAHDVQHLRAKNAQQQGAALEDRRCTKQEEVGLLQHASGIIAIQEEEQNILQECAPETTVIKVEHTLEVHADASAPTAEQLKKLLFIGQRYAPNIVGLQAFLDTAWPEIKKRHPDAELHVAGRVCEVFKHLRDEKVKLHGIVPDLKPLYDMCGIAINPTNFGTGFKIKSIEGLAYKRCVVATQNGTLGLPPGAPLKIAEIQKFADAVSTLISNPAQARELAEQGAQFLDRHFAPDKVYQPLTRLIKSLPAAPQISPSSARLIGHEIIGTDLMLDLHFTDSPAGEETRAVKIEVAAEIGPPIEIWHAVPTGLTDVRFKIPLPIWFRDSTPIRADVHINGAEAGRLTLSCSGSKTDSSLMPNWYYFGLNSQGKLMLAARKSQPTNPQAGPRVFKMYCRNRACGVAVGPLPGAEHNSARWAQSLIFSPADLPARITATVSIYDADGQALVTTLSPRDIRNAVSPQPARPSNSGRAPKNVWKAEWPIQLNKMRLDVAPNSAAPRPFWHQYRTSTEERLTLLFKSDRPLSTATLHFAGNTKEDSVFRWHILLDGTPADCQKEIAATHRATALHFRLERPLKPGGHRIDLICPLVTTDASDTYRPQYLTFGPL